MKVILRWGARERGMLRDAPPFRQAEIQSRCQKNGILLSQACSLRRHHMSLLNPFKSKEALQLGSMKDIKASAILFEEAIATFLHKQRIPFWSEKEQVSQFQRTNPGRRIGGTPDFKLKEPVILEVPSSTSQRHHYTIGAKQKKAKFGSPNGLSNQRTIHWMEGT